MNRISNASFYERRSGKKTFRFGAIWPSVANAAWLTVFTAFSSAIELPSHSTKVDLGDSATTHTRPSVSIRHRTFITSSAKIVLPTVDYEAPADDIVVSNQ